MKPLPFIAPVLDSEGNDTGLICVYEGEEKGKALQKKRLEEAKRKHGDLLKKL
jgi:hypothetical protein